MIGSSSTRLPVVAALGLHAATEKFNEIKAVAARQAVAAFSYTYMHARAHTSRKKCRYCLVCRYRFDLKRFFGSGIRVYAATTSNQE
jgi:hypothetical protein